MIFTFKKWVFGKGFGDIEEKVKNRHFIKKNDMYLFVFLYNSSDITDFK